ncbi:tetratricopeptide repeat protein [Verrucomicrobia bacterium]|jgi:tetratricopeptide (TPR) repeat protein|nr:tetratricopeptide repeat protein [bacterium]MDB4798609.1 tetratricopeptide repeat protein [Verrucomicrobiota bacterium]
MSKKKRGKSSRNPIGSQGGTGSGHTWLFRALAVFLLPVLFFTLLEFGLIQTNYGFSTDFFVSSKNGKHWVENPKFAWQFYSPDSRLRPHPFSLAREKASDTIRIFALGESATLGTPESAYGFVRILERMLSIAFPNQEFEVLNAAMPGINSHLIRSIAEDCSALDPDLFLVYMGNNELVGLHAPGPGSQGLTEHLTLLRLIQWVRSSRTGQLIAPMTQVLAPKQPKGDQDMDFFREHRLREADPGRLAVYQNFRSNLEDILDHAANAKVKTVLSTVAVNLRECPPLGSLHREGLSKAQLDAWELAYDRAVDLLDEGQIDQAIIEFTKAEAIDSEFAELIYRMATCFQRIENVTKANTYFSKARDLDALPFRADSRLNDVIRKVGRDHTDGEVVLLEADRLVGESVEAVNGVPGLETFYEHVHFRFSGDYRLAALFFDRVQSLLGTKLGLGDGEIVETPSLEDCAAALAYNRVNEGLLESSVMDMTSHAPFLDQIDHNSRREASQARLKERYGGLNTDDVAETFRIYQTAMDQYPDDWNLAYLLARLHFTFHNFDAARENLKRASELMPHVLEVRLGYTRALIETKRFEEALREIAIMQKMAPESAEVEAAHGTAKSRQAANR